MSLSIYSIGIWGDLESKFWGRGMRQEKKVGARFWGEIGLFLVFNLVMGNVLNNLPQSAQREL